VAHKAAHYLYYLCDCMATPDAIEAILDLLLSGALPPLEGDLDRWWLVIVRLRREQVKHGLIDEYGPTCECCEAAVGTDLHEVFIKRSDDTSWRQLFIFNMSNCALVCPSCHQSGEADSEGFGEKIRARRRLLT